MRVLSMMEAAGVATRITTTNTAAELAAGLVLKGARKLTEILVQCDPRQDNSIACAWGGTTPTQGGSAIGVVLDPGDSIRIVGEFNCSTFQHISSEAGLVGVIQLIPGY